MTVANRLIAFVASMLQVGLGIFVLFLLLAVYAGALNNARCSVPLLPMWLVADSVLAILLLGIAVGLHYGAWCGASLEGSFAFATVASVSGIGWASLAGMLLWGCLLVGSADTTAREINSGQNCSPVIYWTAWTSVVMQSSGFIGALMLSCVSAIFGANVAYTFLMTNEGKPGGKAGPLHSISRDASPLHRYVTGASAPKRQLRRAVGRPPVSPGFSKGGRGNENRGSYAGIAIGHRAAGRGDGLSEAGRWRGGGKQATGSAMSHDSQRVVGRSGTGDGPRRGSGRGLPPIQTSGGGSRSHRHPAGAAAASGGISGAVT